jgi:hypothetical protein
MKQKVMPLIAIYILMGTRAIPERGELQGDCRGFEDVTVHHNVESVKPPAHHSGVLSHVCHVAP